MKYKNVIFLSAIFILESCAIQKYQNNYIIENRVSNESHEEGDSTISYEKLVKYSINIPNGYKSIKRNFSEGAIYYPHDQVLFINVNEYIKVKEIKNNKVQYFVENFNNEMILCDSISSSTDTLLILKNNVDIEEVLVEHFTTSQDCYKVCKWYKNTISIGKNRICFYLKQNNLELMWVNIFPKNLEKYIELAKTYKEFDKPYGW